MIPAEALRGLIRQVSGKDREGVTYFEFATALAFVHFARSRVGVAVLEVGMGGRLDATNVVRPELSIISNISHGSLRIPGGATRRHCAGEGRNNQARRGLHHGSKTGPCPFRHRQGMQGEESPLAPGGPWDPDPREGGRIVQLSGPALELANLSLALKGSHQRENTACALGALGILRERGFTISDEAIRSGLAAVTWEGRLEIVAERPTILLTGPTIQPVQQLSGKPWRVQISKTHSGTRDPGRQGLPGDDTQAGPDCPSTDHDVVTGRSGSCPECACRGGEALESPG